MPQRYIEIPAPVVLRNPDDGAPLKNDNGSDAAPITFLDFIKKLMFNPKWSESYPNIKSADAVLKALEIARDGVAILAEEDWARLEEAARNPKQVLMTPGGLVTQPGYGYHPRVTMQLLPLIEAVILASGKVPDRMTPKAVEEPQAAPVEAVG